jgi:hypothetical protein
MTLPLRSGSARRPDIGPLIDNSLKCGNCQFPHLPGESITKEYRVRCCVIQPIAPRVNTYAAYPSSSGGIVSQPPDGYYPNQPQVPPPWAGYPQGGVPPAGQGGAPVPSYAPRQASPPRRPHRKPPKKRNIVLLAIAGLFVIGVIAAAVNGSGKPAKSLAATASSTAAARASSSAASRASAAAVKSAKAVDACEKRPPASGDIFVRTVASGDSPKVQRLGDKWAWDHASSKCLTSVQLAMATAPLSAGDCTQVGYVADNPGYDPNATVTAPLAHVAAHAGPACQTTAPPAPAQTTAAPAPAQTTPAPPPAPVQTTPAAAPPPPPPASAAPVSCQPLTNGGNCYEPGEFCRNADHGASGVAGNGEAITCEDNDGWRWEPA